MDTKISCSQNNIYISEKLVQSQIDYKYRDKIGIFSKKFPLNLSHENGFIKINLNLNFGSNISEDRSIEIPINESIQFNEMIEDVNELYNISIQAIEHKIIIDITQKQKGILKFDDIINQPNIKKRYLLRKMINNNPLYYTEQMYLNNCLDISEIVDLICNNSMKTQDWKLLIEYKDDNDNSLINELSVSEIYNKYQDDFKKANVLINHSKNILRFDEIKNILTDYIIFNEEYFELKLNHYDANHKLYIVKREREANPFNYKSYIIKEMDDVTLSIKVPYNELLVDWAKNGDNIDILFGTNLNTAQFIEISENSKIPKNYILLSNNFDGKFYLNGRKALSIYIKKKTKKVSEHATKVAVLGTCFSRNAFNTSDYFNPEYKALTECVYTQFHSTIESLISDINAPKELLDTYRDDNEFKHINTDLTKSFFEELNESGAEYIIIDLYPDATLNQLTLENDSVITYNYLIKENVNLGRYVKGWGDEKFSNEESFISRWLNNLNIFMDKLTQIIPEHKIILNRGRLSKYYYEDNDVKQFGTIHLINRNNYYWELLDNLFIQHYPKVNVVDITDKPYKSDKNYPFGFSYSHYESDYYKTFYSEIIKILYKNKLDIG
ncbi:DUF6270 domain-containing protein [Mammaliicoccus sp. FSL K6-3158]|uniref:DUF6270 domain-containing protein n=1 Tax=Mammaliicoccus TaxID=2803850 RepID=UPI000733FE57|nr:DUF6270 domain-containing protein [Mammaliicoccus sciuri]MEB7435979.1 DUF6270 domain-containing protein [Mammaliicoccus sciuri]MEB8293946.1 DUF6270 domain-containing protein [Mammaliicoccus sciuri]MEB8372606.1 DUF6270 domain-containing protein [Mammaliicoccus sciuri]PCQ20336.1 hypothetical protein CP995_08800 [Klebsiella pneumoniae]